MSQPERQSPGENADRQKFNVFGEQDDHALEDETLGAFAGNRFLIAMDEEVEDAGDFVGRFARDGG